MQLNVEFGMWNVEYGMRVGATCAVSRETSPPLAGEMSPRLGAVTEGERRTSVWTVCIAGITNGLYRVGVTLRGRPRQANNAALKAMPKPQEIRLTWAAT